MKFYSIRTKLILVISSLIGIISLSVYLVFPAHQEKLALFALSEKASSLGKIIAQSLGPAVVFDDHQDATLILERIKQIEDLSYLVIHNLDGSVFDSTNMRLAREVDYTHVHASPELPDNESIYKIVVPIRFDKEDIGRVYLGLSLERIRQENKDNKRYIAIVCLLIFSLGISAVSIISAMLVSPLSKMAGTVERIASGDWSQRTKVQSRDELGSLANSFNRMVENLEAAYKDLSEMNKKLEQRVSERTNELQLEINERRRAVEMLKESEEMARFLLNAPSEAIFLLDAGGGIIDMNKNAAEKLKEGKEKLIGKSFISLFPSGVSTTLQACFNDSIKAGHPVRYEGELDGRLLEITFYPTFDDLGRIIRMAVYSRDVTESRQLDEERNKAAKLESIGVLAGGIAHDFNNLLTAMLGNITMADLLLDVDAGKVREFLKESERASIRARELTQQLLTFSKGGKPVIKLFSISKPLKEWVGFALRGSKVKCEFDISDDLWTVVADEAQINQVVNNLVINADQAMPVGGQIILKAENVVVESGDSLPLDAGRYVKITIKDQGIGIPEEHLSKIFDPYFTTKVKGHGLGLASTYSIIKKHDGHISVESKLGFGTSFHIFLPASEKQIDATEIDKTSRSSFKGRILLMDDEQMVRDVTARELEYLGHEVKCAEEGKTAIEMYRGGLETGKPFDIVIMDLTIPGGMGGQEAIKILLNLDPDAKAIVASGYSNDPVLANYSQHGFSGLITKPFDAKALQDAIEQAVASGKSRQKGL